MQDTSSFIFLIMWIFYSILFLIIYNRIFSVLYAHFFNGLYRQLIVAIFTGAIMTGSTLWFWQTAVIIMLVMGFIVIKNGRNSFGKIPIMIIFIILAIIVGVIGHKVNFFNTIEDSQDITENIENRGETDDTEDIDSSSTDETEAKSDESTLYNDTDDTYNEYENINNQEASTSEDLLQDNEVISNFDKRWYDVYTTYRHENGEHTLGIKEEEGYISISIDGVILTYANDTAGEEMGHERYAYTCDDGSLLTVCYGDGYKIYLEIVGGGQAQGLYYPIEENYLEESNDYIIEGSDKRYISKEEIENLSPEEIRLAKNEIYARHGRIFDSEDLREYFESQSWYHGEIDPEDFDENVLNEYEKANIDLLVSYE